MTKAEEIKEWIIVFKIIGNGEKNTVKGLKVIHSSIIVMLPLKGKLNAILIPKLKYQQPKFPHGHFETVYRLNGPL